ncbi:MAG TPA: hypothetical protein VFV94_07605 [Polyangiaceae bacterium]|nr:hypothetical protein [Polyangiaceae bacterium]
MKAAWFFVFAAVGCGAGAAPKAASGEPPRTGQAPAASAPTSGQAAIVPPSSAAPGASSPPVPATSAAGGAATPVSKRRFPPPNIAPPYPRSAEKGDGEWSPYPEGSPFAKTVLHPHEASRFIEVTLVAIDLGAVSLGYMPGTDDLGGKKVPFVPGLVPEADRARTLAIFNGGFQPQHGHWGMKLGETTVVPPREDGCTLALYADGSVRLRSWPALAATAEGIHAFRQTPPCLFEEGAVHPDLVAGRDKAWAGQNPKLVTRRRSAVGLDASGAVLFYAIGVEAPPKLLAEALRAAGAASGAELDINWNWTRFLLFTKNEEGKLRATTSLAEGDYAKSGYVERPSDRDFFYVLRK